VLRTTATAASDLKDTFAQLRDISVQVVSPGGSSVTNLEEMQRGATDISIAMADVAYLAFAGQLDETSRLFNQLRGMAVLNLNVLNLVVGAKAGVRTIDDLRGRHVALGPVGSATALLAEVLLNAYNIGLSEVHAERLPYSETVERLARGELDAAFITQTLPGEAVVTATRAGARLIDIDGLRVEELRTRHPFLKRTLIPAGTYPNQPDSVRTVGVDLVLVCRVDVDEDLVYRVLEAYFAMQPGSTPRADFERAPATPIPLHVGAARYYRQRELSR
jgi:TRAP transporter TAXI family solute receptor